MTASNSSADGIEALWDDFQDKQGLAFEDVDDWFTSMNYYFYWAGLDNDEADLAWAAMEDAIEHLEDVTGPDVQPSLELLLTLLDDAAAKLETVIAADALDNSAKAYFTSANHFELPSQPFVFWTDIDQENILGWMEFDFPVLAVGDNMHTSYTSSEIGDFISHIDDMWDWIEFGLWLQRHWDDAHQMRQDAAQTIAEVCAYCAQRQTWLLPSDPCFDTAEEAGAFCDWAEEQAGDPFYEDVCDPSRSAKTKLEDLQQASQCYRLQNIGKVGEAATDYLNSYWADQLSW